MGNLKHNTQEDLRQLLSYDSGWSVKGISRDLQIRETTLTDLLSRKSHSERKNSISKTFKITLLKMCADTLRARGEMPTPHVLDEINVLDGINTSAFINKYYSTNIDLISPILLKSIDDYISNKSSQNYIKKFRERFGEVNENNLGKAAVEDTQFLADFIHHGKIKNFTKAVAVSQIGLSLDDNYIGMLKAYTKDPSPLVREGAYRALSEYFMDDEEKYSHLYKFFQEGLENEKGPGVRKQIISLIKLMDMYR